MAIKTRIQLKYDTYSAWTAANTELKQGELAIVTLAENLAQEINASTKQPILFKVGPGKFNDLPWASALAADVYAWAKAQTVVKNGKSLEFKTGDTVVHSVVFDYLTEAEVNTLLENYYTKADIDTKLETIEKSITDLDVSAIVGRVETLETATGTTLPDQISTIDAKFANYTTTTDLNAALDLKADKTQITTLEATLAEVKTTADAAQTAEQVAAAIDTKITAQNLDQYTTEQEVKDIVDGVIKTAADSETYDSLTKLVDYIDTHTGEATQMAQAITTLEGKVDVEKVSTAISDEHTVISKEIDDDIAAEVVRADAAYEAKGAATEVQEALTVEISKKLDANGFTISAGGELGTPPDETGNKYAKLNNGGLRVTSSTGSLTYGPFGITGTVDDYYYGSFAVTDHHMVINTVELLYPEVSGTLATTENITKAVEDLSLGGLSTKDKVSADDLADEVFIFDCGSATEVI